ncbi:hypothetical protein [Streptomyces sp. NPDC008150]|uniref:hypothetical protein n=1 Tax=Streptomyces sp. NPDC008150 TaxID=3364816 RepID=UPI0036EBB0FD
MSEERSTAAEQLGTVRAELANLSTPRALTQERYEEQRRRLEADAEDARKAYNKAKARYDGVCEEMRELRIEWRKQQSADRDDEE